MNPSIQDQIAELISLKNRLEQKYEKQIREINLQISNLRQKLN